MSRYSQLYIERGTKKPDSPRARRRLAAWLDGVDYPFWPPIYHALMRELGASKTLPDSGPRLHKSSIDQFLEQSEVADFLDGITIIFLVLNQPQSDFRATEWRTFARRVFQEEHLGYTIDDGCIVHPFIDPEFQANRSAALEALNDPRFGEARTDFDAAFRQLRDGEGKAAIRSMSPAVETAAKVLCPGAMARLMPNEVDRYFLPKLRQVYAGNEPAIDAGTQLLHGMKDWITAAQPYRHGQDVEEPAEPPVEFVVAFLSVGAVYLRWLIELYA